MEGTGLLKNDGSSETWDDPRNRSITPEGSCRSRTTAEGEDEWKTRRTATIRQRQPQI